MEQFIPSCNRKLASYTALTDLLKLTPSQLLRCNVSSSSVENRYSTALGIWERRVDKQTRTELLKAKLKKPSKLWYSFFFSFLFFFYSLRIFRLTFLFDISYTMEIVLFFVYLERRDFQVFHENCINFNWSLLESSRLKYKNSFKIFSQKTIDKGEQDRINWVSDSKFEFQNDEIQKTTWFECK